MPNALMEALTVGIPCVSTDCPIGGPKMLINNEKNGLLVPINDCQSLEKAIIRILTDDYLSDKLAKAAKKSANNFEIEKVGNDWLNYIYYVYMRVRQFGVHNIVR